MATTVTDNTKILVVYPGNEMLKNAEISSRFVSLMALRKYYFCKATVFIDKNLSNFPSDRKTVSDRSMILALGSELMVRCSKSARIHFGSRVETPLDEYLVLPLGEHKNWLFLPIRGCSKSISIVDRNQVLARFEIPSRPVKPAEDETLPFDEIVCTNNPWLNWESATLAPNGQAYFEFEIGGPSKWWMLVSANPNCGNVEICVDWDNAAPPQTFTIKNSNRTPLYKHLVLAPPLENHGKHGSCTITVRG
ncbi:MAG: hypothetical protein QXI12_13095, partial [Candidatus Methanomethyliaceae archaeon]